MTDTAESLDDRTTRYVLAAAAAFASLRTLATQLAGFVLVVTVDPRNHQLQDTPLRRFDETLAEATDTLCALRPPERAAHHHHHLSMAARDLALAGRLVRRDLVTVRRAELADACEAPLNRAIAHLRHAAKALPGFEMVDLANACCAAHAPAGAA